MVSASGRFAQRLIPVGEPAAIGMRVFIASDACTFIALLVAFAVVSEADPTPAPSLALGLVMAALLLAASALLQVACRHRWAPIGAAALGCAYVAVQVFEYSQLIAEGLRPGHSRFADGFYALTAFHGAHVIAGVAALIAIAATAAKPATVAAARLYWHFVDAMWLIIVAGVYL